MAGAGVKASAKEKKADELLLGEALAQISINYREIRRAPGKLFWAWWAVVFVALTAICLVAVYDQSKDFFNNAIKTTDTKKNLLSIRVPKVTFCTSNWIDFNQLNQHLYEKWQRKLNETGNLMDIFERARTERRYWRHLFMDRFRFASINEDTITNISTNATRLEINSRHPNTTDRQDIYEITDSAFVLRCEDVFHQCKLGLHKDFDCCSRNSSESAVLEWHVEDKKCFTLVLAKNQTVDGVSGGLDIILRQPIRGANSSRPRPKTDVPASTTSTTTAAPAGGEGLEGGDFYETDPYNAFWEERMGEASELNPSGFPCGFRRWVRSNGGRCGWDVFVVPEDSDRLYSDNNLVTTTSNQVLIKVSRQHRKLMLPPHGSCTDNSRLLYFPRYNRKLCETELMIKEYSKACGCMPFGMLFQVEFPQGPCTKQNISRAHCLPKGLPGVCDIIRTRKCIPSVATPEDRQRRECSTPCESTVLTISSNTIPGQMVVSEFDTTGLRNRLNTDLTRVFIYYGSIAEMVSEQSAALTFADLTAKVGASFSLWLGFKFMTFLQLFYFLYWHLFKRTAADPSSSLIRVQPAQAAQDPAKTVSPSPLPHLLTPPHYGQPDDTWSA